MKTDKKTIKKSLGQHYLVNKNVVKKIASLANENNPEHIVEIGAGTGLLTVELTKTSAKIYAIEIEKESLEELQKNEDLAQSLDNKKLTLHQANALKVDYQQLIATIISTPRATSGSDASTATLVTSDITSSTNLDTPDTTESTPSSANLDTPDATESTPSSANKKPFHLNICGNLPYNIASKLIIKILEDLHNLLAEKPEAKNPKIQSPATKNPETQSGKMQNSEAKNCEKYLEEWRKNPEKLSMVFLIQKEVASRLIALGKEKEKRGISSYLLAWHGTAKWRFHVAPGSFFPPPKVTSSVISITLHQQFLPHQKIYPMYKNCVKVAFQKRRKMIGNVLKQALPEYVAALEIFFQTNPHLKKQRAEEWSVKDYFDLASHLTHSSPTTPAPENLARQR